MYPICVFVLYFLFIRSSMLVQCSWISFIVFNYVDSRANLSVSLWCLEKECTFKNVMCTIRPCVSSIHSE